jgi:hypothetical protein
MTVIEVIKLGQRYLNLWPEKPELAHYFSEYRVIKFSRLMLNIMPALAVFVLLMQVYWFSDSLVLAHLVYPLFMLSLPIQSLVMLGVKADKFLPPALANWYREGVAKINQQGGNIKLSIQKPRYIDLAELLHLTYQQKA